MIICHHACFLQSVSIAELGVAVECGSPLCPGERLSLKNPSLLPSPPSLSSLHLYPLLPSLPSLECAACADRHLVTLEQLSRTIVTANASVPPVSVVILVNETELARIQSLTRLSQVCVTGALTV